MLTFLNKNLLVTQNPDQMSLLIHFENDDYVFPSKLMATGLRPSAQNPRKSCVFSHVSAMCRATLKLSHDSWVSAAGIRRHARVFAI